MEKIPIATDTSPILKDQKLDEIGLTSERPNVFTLHRRTKIAILTKEKVVILRKKDRESMSNPQPIVRRK